MYLPNIITILTVNPKAATLKLKVLFVFMVLFDIYSKYMNMYFVNHRFSKHLRSTFFRLYWANAFLLEARPLIKFYLKVPVCFYILVVFH